MSLTAHTITFGEAVISIGNQQAGLSYGTISNNNQFDSFGGHV